MMLTTIRKNGLGLKAAVVAALTISAMDMAAQDIYRTEDEPSAVQLRTNGVFDLALCPNIGMEVQIDKGLAWQIDYIGAWWNSYARNRFYSNYAFQTEMRYYLGKEYTAKPYAGHHIGAYGQLATFDFEFGGKGYQSRDLDFSFGIGISYGYAFPLNRRWTLDITAGLGYFHSRYDVYYPAADGYQRTATRHLNYVGPTKLEAAFVYNINAKNR